MADAKQPSSSKDSMNNPAVNLAFVLRDESDEVTRLCENRGAVPDLAVGANGGKPHRLGVAFSGGGIRSASVNLGIIQGLAKAGILKQVHYMSGISGGGYILGWLTSWIRRSGFQSVQEQLVTKRASDGVGPAVPPPVYNRFLEPNTIRHLREYASYLTPRMGLGSGDTLAMISIYLRNVLLNQSLIISVVACMIALAQLLAPWIAWRRPVPAIGQIILLAVGLISGVTAGILAGQALQRLGSDQFPKYERRKAGISSAVAAMLMAICLWVILPTTFTSAFLGNPLFPQHREHPVIVGALLAGMFMFAMYLAGFLTDSLGGKEILISVEGRTWKIVVAALLAIIAAVAFLFTVLFGFEKWLHHSGQVYVGDWYVMLGLPAIMLAMALASYVHIGIFGDVFPDAKREWLGRLAGYYLYFSAIIALIMIGSLRGPLWMHLLFRGISASTGSGAWLKWILPGGWVFTVVSGVVAGASPRTGNSSENKSRTLDIVAKIAPPVFLAGVFLIVSWGVYTLANYAGAPKYLTWVEETVEGSPVYKFVKPSADGNTTLVYPASAKDSLSNRKSIFELRGCRWEADPASAGASVLSPNCTPPANLVPTGSNQPAAAAEDPVCGPGANMADCLPQTKDLPREPHERLAPECAPALWCLIRALLLVAAAAAAIAATLMKRLDVNEFSMHLFYRNRLVRAFLGASNAKSNQNPKGRRPSPFTGFALDDDVPLQELCSWWKREQDCHTTEKPARSTGPSSDCYDGPYPIWGTALNLTAGEDLAWQKRKAASFIYSPLYCGWDYVSKAATHTMWETPGEDRQCEDDDGSDHRVDRCKYAYRGTGKFTSTGEFERVPYTGHGCGPFVGTAMAASGAAISPNWGYHTSPAVAALLAIFNVRIGWWTGNPRRKDSWNNYAPGAYYLTAELMGATDDSGRYVYLSDGGHFEDLGIYELVRRRMKYIISCDADSDPDYIFDDLANAVEKCRRDFGVEIEIDTSAIRPNKKSQLSKSHFAIGKITYPPVPGDNAPAFTGVLVFFKSSLTGDESADILGQRSVNSRFPHDTTVNQFFNETQFEVYRALGEHMFDTLWEYYKHAPEKPIVPVEKNPAQVLSDFFTRLDDDRKKKHHTMTEKQQKALRPEA